MRLMRDLEAQGLQLQDIETKQNSLEDIFVGLVHKTEEGAQ
jgi:ABC-2 type transport system ATP-binding protein